MHDRESLHRFQIEALQKQLSVMRMELETKDQKIEHLENKLVEEQSKTAEWQEKFEIQDLKTERAHQHRIEQEQKVSQLQSVVSRLRGEIEKSNCVQIVLGKQISSLSGKLKEQQVALEEKESVNVRLAARVADLTNLCVKANRRIDEDTNKIAEHEKTLSECNDFVTAVKKRESRILKFVHSLKTHYERKNERCLSFLRRPSRASEIVRDLYKLLVDEGDIGIRADQALDHHRRQQT